ncbi:MAG: dTMP kinase [Eubacterium sp.]|nr:dTMP kinase [Eubacterium sp.]
MDTGKKGILIALEGIDGSGKSTQARLLSDRMREMGIPFYMTMEPTDSPIGSMIRQVMTGRMQADPKVIAALFVADRLDHLLNEGNGIAGKIEEGISVIMDRYYFSSYAYQSVDVPLDWLIQANALSSSILRPTVNVFIDTDPDTAMERIVKNRFATELFEERDRLVQVRRNYLEAFERLGDKERVTVIDGNRSQETVAQEVWDAVAGYFIE